VTTVSGRSSHGLAFDVGDPDVGGPGVAPILLVHAGVCDRRMWQLQWEAFAARWRTIRVDLRGFGESDLRPTEPFAHHADVAALLDELDAGPAHLVGCSLGAGVATEVALARPELTASLLLISPAGALLNEPSEDLSRFWREEGEALERGDLDAAVEANLRTWVEGPHRRPAEVDPSVRATVAAMQRRAFEIIADWDDLDDLEDGLEPPAKERLEAIDVPTLVLAGDGDLPVVSVTARTLAARIPRAELVVWPVVAHLPSLERPAGFERLAMEWFERVPGWEERRPD
jgi:3-oxoadipate enol-lactonase